MPPPRKCIVVGAGLAGLSAANALATKGWTVDVFEAKDRPGGRVLTQGFPEGKPRLTCELGAEWIGQGHDEVQRLCKAVGLKTEDHKYSTRFWLQDRRPRLSRLHEPADRTLSEKSDDKYETFLEQFRNGSLFERRRLDLLDWHTQLERIGLTESELRQRELEDGTDFGESIRMASAYVVAVEYAYSSYTDELDLKVRGGNGQLADRLAARIGNHRVHRNSVVKRIHQARDKVHVTVEQSRRLVEPAFEADACICTVPASVLGKIQWSPAPEEHLDAALQLQYSRITKTAVHYPRRFWKTSKGPRKNGFALFTSRVADFCFDSAYSQPGPDGILCSYSFGEKAANVASEQPEDMARWISEDVQEALGAKRSGVPGTAVIKAWHDDPYCRGAYAFYRPGQWFTIRPILQRPFGRVLFAGEHLSDNSGFMEGAVRSGLDAAALL